MATIEQQFALTPSQLFEVLVTPETYPHWLVGTKRIRTVSPLWPSVGSYFDHVVGIGPVQLGDRTNITAIERPRMLELQVRARPLVKAKVRFELDADPGGCVLRMTETPVGAFKLASVVLQPLIHARNARSIRNLLTLVGDRQGASVGPAVSPPRRP